MNELFLRVEKLRVEKGATYKELAKACGVSPQNVQRWKSGGTIMPEHLNKLSVYFGVSVDYIMTGTMSRIIDPETPTTPDTELIYLRNENALLRADINYLREALTKSQENLAAALERKN